MKRLLSACAVLALGAGVMACGADGTASEGTGTRTLPAAAPETPAPEAPAPEPLVSELSALRTADDIVNVYWAWSIDTIIAGTPEKLGAGARAGTTPDAALQALLAGPDAIEIEIGMGTSIPRGTQLLGVEVSGGVATVDLSGEINQSSGSLDEIMRFGQVVFTLTQFADVDGVAFRIDGVDVTELGSHGLAAADPLTRDDFAEVRPFILVEYPFPGAIVGDGDIVSGESNTFEANVQFAVTDGDGLMIAEGFTTATGGNGTWGTFDEPLVLPAGLTGRGAVIVFESSAQDGSQVNIVEYPIFFDDPALPESR